jgi:hypothetical protein
MEDWFASKKNKNMILFATAIPLLFSWISAVLYFYILQGDGIKPGIGKHSSWVIWWIVTILVSLILMYFMAPELSKVKHKSWLSNYIFVLSFGSFISIFSFWLFSRRFWWWVNRSAARGIPRF